MSIEEYVPKSSPAFPLKDPDGAASRHAAAEEGDATTLEVLFERKDNKPKDREHEPAGHSHRRRLKKNSKPTEGEEEKAEEEKKKKGAAEEEDEASRKKAAAEEEAKGGKKKTGALDETAEKTGRSPAEQADASKSRAELTPEETARIKASAKGPAPTDVAGKVPGVDALTDAGVAARSGAFRGVVRGFMKDTLLASGAYLLGRGAIGALENYAIAKFGPAIFGKEFGSTSESLNAALAGGGAGMLAGASDLNPLRESIELYKKGEYLSALSSANVSMKELVTYGAIGVGLAVISPALATAAVVGAVLVPLGIAAYNSPIMRGLWREACSEGGVKRLWNVSRAIGRGASGEGHFTEQEKADAFKIAHNVVQPALTDKEKIALAKGDSLVKASDLASAHKPALEQVAEEDGARSTASGGKGRDSRGLNAKADVAEQAETEEASNGHTMRGRDGRPYKPQRGDVGKLTREHANDNIARAEQANQREMTARAEATVDSTLVDQAKHGKGFKGTTPSLGLGLQGGPSGMPS